MSDSSDYDRPPLTRLSARGPDPREQNPRDHDPRSEQPAEQVSGGQAGDIRAPTKPRRTPKASSSAAIVPAGSVTGNSLTLVISIMCFLACLTAGAVYLINQSASAWMRNISNEATVQVPPKEGVDVEQEITKVALFLAKEPGIAGVRPFTLEQSTALLEPWLGNSEALKLLPIPRLIALELDRQSPPDLQALGQSLAAEFPSVTLDDHRHWRVQIQTVTRSLALGGVAILVLVGAATTAIIIAATRAAMAANREIVEVLHFVGATDRFIAREFERHFLALGIRAGLVGAVLAIGVFVLLPGIMVLLGGGGSALSETDRLIGTGSIDVPGYVLLGIVVVVIAALCMLTSRYGVFRILHARN